MASDGLSATQLTQFYLERIAHHNPSLNCLIETNPEALKLAAQLDRERAKGNLRGPLHGIPIVLKDNIATADKMHTSAGSWAMRGSKAPHDAFLVTRLRQAGAILLGKANMTEWANFMAVGMKNGYSSRGGQTKNPYGDFDTGGSSSGSGVAPSANLCAVAVGSETSGSILSPANQSSVVGIKPTVGLVSRSGVVPISATQDTAGPMGRSVTDAAIVLGAMVGVDAKDPASKASRGKFHDYTQFLDKAALKGARIGIPRQAFYERLDPAELEVVERAIRVLKDLGAKVVDPANLPSAKEVFELRWEVLLYEFRRDLNRYLRTLGEGAPFKSLLELIRYHEAHPQRMLRYGQERMLAAQAALGTGAKTYAYARAKDLAVCKGGIDAVMQQHRLDALLFPTYWGAAVGAKPGYPSVIVPAGYTDKGLPVGITFLGQAWAEPRLIGYAYAYEQASKARRKPRGF
jgi:amidase